MSSLSIGNKLYFSVLSVFVVFATAFIVFQQHREKQYKISTLNLQLQDYNERMHVSLTYNRRLSPDVLNQYVSQHHMKNLRVTLIDRRGKVFFDNIYKNYKRMQSHANRPEFVQAIRTGKGSAVDRNSTTLKQNFFYSSTYFPRDGYVIRTALPYDSNLAKSLQADQHYIWFSLAAMLLLTLLLYPLTRHMGQNIAKLRLFASKADHNESLDIDDLAVFPDDELGEIAERIIKLYKRLQTTRQEQERLKHELTQNVAHELKTPVASIQGFLETILHNPDISEEAKQQFLERCYAQSIRLGSLLRDISTLNRMDDGKGMIHFEPQHVNALVEQILAENALRLSQRDMTFQNLLPENIVVNGNRDLLYSIFSNLTDNAIAYAGQGTTVTLTAQAEHGIWRFCFKDNGTGVPKEHLSRLFERFYRVDKGRSRKAGGTGLGLAIVKNAVLLHGGSIRATLNDEGGLAFHFTL